MMSKESHYLCKQKEPLEKTEEVALQKHLSTQELNRINIEMNWGYGMLPPGCFSYGIWYFH